MIEKIKEALRNAGLDEGLADRIKVNDESEIEGAIGKLKKRNEMLEMLKDNDFLDTFNAETDRRISKALDTFQKNLEEKQQKKTEKKDDKKADKEVEKQTDTSLEAFQKLLEDKLAPFTKTIQALSAKDREYTVKARLKDAGLPESFTKFVTADTDDAMIEEITGLKEQYGKDIQAQIDAKIKAGEYVPSQGKAGESVNVERIRTYAKSRSQAGNFGNVEQPFTGKKLNVDKE